MPLPLLRSLPTRRRGCLRAARCGKRYAYTRTAVADISATVCTSCAAAAAADRCTPLAPRRISGLRPTRSRRTHRPAPIENMAAPISPSRFTPMAVANSRRCCMAVSATTPAHTVREISRETDDTITHAPAVTAEDACLCLISADAPMRLKGQPARFIQALAGTLY